jgi:hypothetical protein
MRLHDSQHSVSCFCRWSWSGGRWSPAAQDADTPGEDEDESSFYAYDRES